MFQAIYICCFILCYYISLVANVTTECNCINSSFYIFYSLIIDFHTFFSTFVPLFLPYFLCTLQAEANVPCASTQAHLAKARQLPFTTKPEIQVSNHNFIMNTCLVARTTVFFTGYNILHLK